MSDWLSDGPSDLLLFSKGTCFRLYELYNNAFWPLHTVALALGLLLIGLLYIRSAYRQQMLSLILVGVWLWIGWGFHLQHYATINWAAPGFAVLFFLQAILLTWFGLIGRRLDFVKPRMPSHGLGLGLVIYAVLLHPLLGFGMRRVWSQAEVFAMAPDPTAIATLGLLLLAQVPHRWLLFIVPILWCGIGAMTLFAMPTVQYRVPALAALLAVLAGLTRAVRARRRRG